MEEISGHFFILIQPHDNKRFKPAAEEERTNRNKFRVTVSVEGGWGVHGLLTPDIQGHVSGKWAALCSTRCRATSPWNASSCNRRFCIAGASHALDIKHRGEKKKEDISNLALQTRASALSDQQKTYPPWRISYLVQTYSTSPLHWSCPHSVPAEIWQRQNRHQSNFTG